MSRRAAAWRYLNSSRCRACEALAAGLRESDNGFAAVTSKAIGAVQSAKSRALKSLPAIVGEAREGT